MRCTHVSFLRPIKNLKKLVAHIKKSSVINSPVLYCIAIKVGYCTIVQITDPESVEGTSNHR